MRFSERIGVIKPRLAVQKAGMDHPLRNGLWSCLVMTILDFQYIYGEVEERFEYLAKRTFLHFLKLPIDDTPMKEPSFTEYVREWYFSSDWNHAYDFLEFMATVENYRPEWEEKGGKQRSDRFIDFANDTLAEEMSAYRFVDRRLVEITDQIEIDAVDTAAGAKGKFGPCGQHIQSAIALFSSRKDRDLRNTVKESILAVEAAARIISGKPSATLGDAIKAIDKKHSLHSALKEGLMKLYGYSSDEGGIRHSLLEATNLDAADAKFMLVACSAFCNYLIERYGGQ